MPTCWKCCRVWATITVVCLVTISLYIGIFYGQPILKTGPILPTAAVKNTLKTKLKSDYTCVRPELELWPPGFKELFQSASPPICSKEEDWIYTSNGLIHVSKLAQEAHGSIECQGVTIERGKDDFTVVYGDRIKLFKDETPLTSDFVEVTCVAEDGTKYENIHAGIRRDAVLRKREVQRVNEDVRPLDLSIFVLVLDSVSRMTWLRSLPRTYTYLVDVLDAFVFEGYNILGDGTKSAIIPLLTGKMEPQLPETKKEFKNATTYDRHPLIWKELEELGYVTQYGEDMTNSSTFHYKSLGFQVQPTDHYMRPFYLKTEDRFGNESAFCWGSHPRHQIILNWFKEFIEMYPKQRQFSFMLYNEYSHGYIDRLSWADEDLVELLKFLNTKKHLEDTILLVMSDHGQRLHQIRRTLQGKYEERLPFVSLRLPPRFQQEHPEVMKNVRTNTQRLTTAFDLYATLREVINFTGVGVGDVRSRGISLFKEIPSERTCENAEILSHWCMCLEWEDIDVNDRLVQRAARFIVALINNATLEDRDYCAELSLLNITSAAAFFPNELLLRYNRTGRVYQVPGLDDVVNDPLKLYQVTLVTRPNLGVYEATVQYLFGQDRFVGNVNEISRINRYANQPHCIRKEKPDLRPYCYCRTQLP